MFSNLKTTIAGIAPVVVALGDILTFAAHGQITPHLSVDLAAFSAGLGLFLAKDHSA